jgi:hypothetical protein
MSPQLPAQLMQFLAPLPAPEGERHSRRIPGGDTEIDHPRMESTNPRLPAHSFIRSLFVDGSPQRKELRMDTQLPAQLAQFTAHTL